MTSSWRTYEEVAQYLLNQIADRFGLDRVEPKQSLDGINTGTAWEIDAKGVRLGDGATVIIECRRHKSSLTQEAIGALAFRIDDTGAASGIVVTPIGLQEGAGKVALSSGIVTVTLRADSTTTEFLMRFLNTIWIGLPSDGISVSATIISARLETVVEQDDPSA